MWLSIEMRDSGQASGVYSTKQGTLVCNRSINERLWELERLLDKGETASSFGVDEVDEAE